VAAGLPDIILHGTATLALAISRLVGACLDGDPTRVTRLGGRFSAMVLMPSTLTLVLHRDLDGEISFTMFNEQGERAISHGFLCHK
jgi:acyl dehydratase